ncbi:MAG TPA: hypothetical protein VFZ61_33010 [Polyangiales bacterium]
MLARRSSSLLSTLAATLSVGLLTSWSLTSCSRAPSAPEPAHATRAPAPAPVAPPPGDAPRYAEPLKQPLDTAAGGKSSLGINLGAVRYYAQQIMFLDLAKQAADWGLNSGGVAPQLDAQGWPVALQPGHGAGFVANAGKGGRYVMLFDGKGKLNVGGGKILDEAPGRVLVQLDGGETHFTIAETDPQAPLRNLHIVPIEHEKDHAEVLFHPQFLELVKPFSVLRFMDYFETNGSKQVRWSDRATPDYFSQGTDKGGAIEYAIALCNRLKADCWFNIPHMADDDYVRHYAELVRDQLDPGLRAYVEYSNEVWNFQHGDWIQQAGEKVGMKREWDTRLRYQARRSIQIFDTFAKVLGRSRLVRVMAGQCFALRLQILLDQDGAFKHADAIAIAPYFGYDLTDEKNVASLRGESAEAVSARVEASLANTRKQMRELKALADHYKLPLIGYEGGQHLATGGALHQDTKLQALLDDVNRAQRMGDTYRKYLELWRDEGGQLMVLYKLVEGYSQWGRWGLLEDMWQPLQKAPKYAATMMFIKQQPRWWREPNRASAQ